MLLIYFLHIETFLYPKVGLKYIKNFFWTRDEPLGHIICKLPLANRNSDHVIPRCLSSEESV
jgi:hypothetical protein